MEKFAENLNLGNRVLPPGYARLAILHPQIKIVFDIIEGSITIILAVTFFLLFIA